VNHISLFILIIFLLMLALIVLPWKFDIKGEIGENQLIRGRFKWAGGLLKLEVIAPKAEAVSSLTILGITISPGRKNVSPSPAKKKKKAGPKKDKGMTWKSFSSFVDRQLAQVLYSFARNIIKGLHIKLQLEGKYGFDDPSLTGLIFGLQALLDSDNTLALQPDFGEAVLDIKLDCQGKIIPLQLFGLSISFVFQKPVRKIWLSLIKNKIKIKEAIEHA
jgi:hypothetical protein